MTLAKGSDGSRQPTPSGDVVVVESIDLVGGDDEADADEAAEAFEEADVESQEEDEDDVACEACGLGDDEENLMLCEDCPRGWHIYCLRPKLRRVPKVRSRRPRSPARYVPSIFIFERGAVVYVPGTPSRAVHLTVMTVRPTTPTRHADERSGTARLYAEDSWRCVECSAAAAAAAAAEASRRPTRAARPKDLRDGGGGSDSDEDAGGGGGGGGDDGVGRGTWGSKRKREGSVASGEGNLGSERRPQRKSRRNEPGDGGVDAKGDDEVGAVETHPVSGSESDAGSESEADSFVDAIVCSACDAGDDEQKIILCDGCDAGYHIYCLRPKLTQIPRGKWFCPKCTAEEEAREATAAAAAAAKQARVEAAAAVLDGRKVQQLIASRRVAEPIGPPTPPLEAAGAPRPPPASDIEFLCKFEYRSYRQLEWLPLWVLRESNESKIRAYWKRTNSSPVDPVVLPEHPEAWTLPERVVHVDENEGEMLVKWQGLNYDDCTWEPIDDASDEAVAKAAAVAAAQSPGKLSSGKKAGVRRRESNVSATAADDEGSGEGNSGEERLVDGGGNEGVAAELAMELAAYKARSDRPPPPKAPLPEACGTGAIIFENIAHLLPEVGMGYGTGTDAAAASAKAAIAAAAAGDQAIGTNGGQVPKGLTLHKYQREGVQWLLTKLKLRQSAILGDQMGLGKTIQTAVFVDAARTLGLLRGPVLICAPLSTVPNWTAELRLWCPSLNCVTYIGNAEARATAREYEFPNGGKGRNSERAMSGASLDVLLTSYEIAMSDAHALEKLRWGALIVDEGHRLKNFQSRLSRTLANMHSPFRCLLTGTPLQNNMEELFALLHFLEPVKFKDPVRLAEVFTSDAARVALQEKEDASGSDSEGPREIAEKAAAEQLKNLHQLLGNHMLRRLKRDVLKGLPKKRKVEVSCQLSPFQREVYADILARNHRAFNQGTHASQRTSLLNVLKELQKVCNHPFLFASAEKDAFRAARKSGLATKVAAAAAAEKKAGKGDIVAPSPLEATLLQTSSGKMQLLAKMLPKLRERGHRVLLFCQMTKMLDLIEDWLRASGLGVKRRQNPERKGVDEGAGDDDETVYGRIDGSTPAFERQRTINAFNNSGSNLCLLLVSTRAGGLGLNLATADTIVLFDPDFNPFVDLQAQARAHRMGQQREVAVYQLVTAGTVEERIVQIARGKLAIERLVVAEAGKADDKEDKDKVARAGRRRGDPRGRASAPEDDDGVSGSSGGGGSNVTGKAGQIRGRVAELAEVLMHGAKGVMVRAAIKGNADGDNKGRMLSAAAEPTDAEIERLMDRANLPEEVDGEDGGRYLGNVGNATIAIGDADKVGDEAGSSEDGDAAGEDGHGGCMQLDLLLHERAARLAAAETEELGRGKRERRTVIPAHPPKPGGEGEPNGNGGGVNGGASVVGTCIVGGETCHLCGGADDRENLLLCELCTAGAHTMCLGMSCAPEGKWYCGVYGGTGGGEGTCAEIGTAFPKGSSRSQLAACGGAALRPGDSDSEGSGEEYVASEASSDDEEDDDLLTLENLAQNAKAQQQRSRGGGGDAHPSPSEIAAAVSAQQRFDVGVQPSACGLFDSTIAAASRGTGTYKEPTFPLDMYRPLRAFVLHQYELATQARREFVVQAVALQSGPPAGLSGEQVNEWVKDTIDRQRELTAKAAALPGTSRKKLAHAFTATALEQRQRKLTLKSVESVLSACTTLLMNNPMTSYRTYTWDDGAASATYAALAADLAAKAGCPVAGAPRPGAVVQQQQPMAQRPAGQSPALPLAPPLLGGSSTAGPVSVGGVATLSATPTTTDRNRLPAGVVAMLLPVQPMVDEPSKLTQTRRGPWVLAVRGPLAHLEMICNTRPIAHPVKFVSKMASACGRLGLVVDARAGCVRLCIPNPDAPGTPCLHWFPLEAVGMLPMLRGGRVDCWPNSAHTVRVLPDRALVEHLCNTKPDEHPVKFVRAVGAVVGREGQLVDSRGDIVQVRFARLDDRPTTTGMPQAESLVWLPKEAVEVVTFLAA